MSYKEPLYDTVAVLAATPNADRIFFQRPLGQTLEDGATIKTRLHTNLSQAGQLGVPVSFDVYGFNMRYAKKITIGDYRIMTANGVITFISGEDTQFLGIPAEDLPSGVDTEGPGTTDSPHVGQGDTDNYYRFDIGGQGLHLNSTESFKVTYTFPSGNAGLTADQLVKFYVRGVKYKGV